MTDRLIAVCTANGKHERRIVGRFFLMGRLGDKGFAVWDPNADPATLTIVPVIESTRQTSTGKNKVQRAATTIEARSRADGGTTYVLGICRSCRRRRQIRDDVIVGILRSRPDTPEFDVSRPHDVLPS